MHNIPYIKSFVVFAIYLFADLCNIFVSQEMIDFAKDVGLTIIKDIIGLLVILYIERKFIKNHGK